MGQLITHGSFSFIALMMHVFVVVDSGFEIEGPHIKCMSSWKLARVLMKDNTK